jgi:hypothetical protein
VTRETQRQERRALGNLSDCAVKRAVTPNRSCCSYYPEGYRSHRWRPDEPCCLLLRIWHSSVTAFSTVTIPPRHEGSRGTLNVTKIENAEAPGGVHGASLLLVFFWDRAYSWGVGPIHVDRSQLGARSIQSINAWQSHRFRAKRKPQGAAVPGASLSEMMACGGLSHFVRCGLAATFTIKPKPRSGG